MVPILPICCNCQECGFELQENPTKKLLTEVSKQDEFIGYIQITSVIEIALGSLIALLGLLIVIFGLVASEDAFKTEYALYFVNYLKIVLLILGFLLILLGCISIYFGSSHTTLGPYWSAKLGKTELQTIQLSKRTGKLKLIVTNSRVYIKGKSCTILSGKFNF